MRLSRLSFNASTNECITHQFVFASLKKNSFFNFLNCYCGHLGFFHFKTSPLHGLCGTFFMHFRHANEHKPAEKPSPTILLNLSTLLTGLWSMNSCLYILLRSMKNLLVTLDKSRCSSGLGFLPDLVTCTKCRNRTKNKCTLTYSICSL